MTSQREDKRHDPESALREITQIQGVPLLAADSDAEAVAIHGQMTKAYQDRLQADANRHAEGRFYLFEAARDIAKQRGFDNNKFELNMRIAAELPRTDEFHLKAHDPYTGLPPQGVRVHGAWIVYPHEVNDWLTRAGVGYQWDNVNVQPPVAAHTLRKQKATTLQDDNIIAAIRERGIDPQKMPRPPLGNKPWPLREEIAQQLGYSKTIMVKAFTRLRKDGRMNHE